MLDEGLAAAVRAGDYYLTAERLEGLRETIATALAERAARVPLDPGIPVAELLPQRPWSASILPLLPLERRGAKAYAPGASARLGDRAEAASALLSELDEAGLTPVKASDPGLAAYLEGEGRLVRLPDGHVLGADAFAEARRLVVGECEAAGSISGDQPQGRAARPRAPRYRRRDEARGRRARPAPPGSGAGLARGTPAFGEPLGWPR
jgi:hypothetical protein